MLNIKKEIAAFIGERFYDSELFDDLPDMDLSMQISRISFVFTFSSFFNEKEVFFQLLDKISEFFESLHLTVKKRIVCYLMKIEEDKDEVFSHLIENGMIDCIFSLIEGAESETCRAVCMFLFFLLDSLSSDNLENLKSLAEGECWIDKLEETIDDDGEFFEANKCLEDTLEKLKELCGVDDDEDDGD